MPTAREVISDIVNAEKSLNIDDRKSNRYILSQVRDKVSVLIKQDTDTRRLFAVSEVWRRIKCVDMQELDSIECCSGIPNCKTMMRSRKKIPAAYLSSYGTIIKVMVINSESEYKQTTRAKYKDIMNREYQSPNTRYFWIEDNYLFIPNSQVKSVSVLGLFLNPIEVDSFNDDCDDASDCLSPLDAPFPAPDYLLSIAKSQVIQEYAGVTARLVEDENPNQNQNLK